MHMSRALRAAVALSVVVVAVGCASAGRLQQELPDNVDIDAADFYRFGEVASAVYEADEIISKVEGGYTVGNGWKLQVFDLPLYKGRAFLLTHHATARQIVVSRGTANKKNVAVDLSYSKVWNEKLQCYLHKGFHDSAVETWETVLPQLNPDYAISFTGHSLGGAIAAICGMGAVANGFKVEYIITFGQPKITNREGAERWDADMQLPLTRVVHGQDSVTVLPMVKPSDIWQHGSFWQFGIMALFSDDGTFEILTSAAARTSGHTSYWSAIVTGDRIPLAGLMSHPMSAYLEALWRWVPHHLRLEEVAEPAEPSPLSEGDEDDGDAESDMGPASSGDDISDVGGSDAVLPGE
jgi:hypothetical protein